MFVAMMQIGNVGVRMAQDLMNMAMTMALTRSHQMLCLFLDLVMPIVETGYVTVLMMTVVTVLMIMLDH